MRFAHIADVHLGRRQYGLWERGLDYSNAFTHAVDTILKRNVAFVLVSGDLFDSRLPPAFAVRKAFTELMRLREARIPVYAIRGNHDAVEAMRGGNYLNLLADAGLIQYLETPDQCFRDLIVEGERVRILGFGCSPEAFVKTQVEAVKAKVDPKADYNLLMMHQTFDRVEAREQSYPVYTSQFYEEPFKHICYYALGHIHEHALKHPELPAYYPGSLESWDLQDAETLEYTGETGGVNRSPQRAKGILIVEVEGSRMRVESITLPCRRVFHLVFRYVEVDPGKATEDILGFLNAYNVEDSIVNVTVYGCVIPGTRRSELMVGKVRRVLSKPLKVRVNNNLTYPGLRVEEGLRAQVSVESALLTYFSERLKDVKEAESLTKVAATVFHLLEQRESDKAKEVLERAF